MTIISDFRQKNPQYNDLSDEQLADRFYKKFYSDMDRGTFNKKVGLESAKKEEPISLKEKIPAVVSAPGFAAAEVLQHPMESAKTAYKGIKEAVPIGYGRMKEAVSSAGAGLKTALDPDKGIGERLKGGGAAALDVLSIPGQIPVTALERTYGKLAEKGAQDVVPLETLYKTRLGTKPGGELPSKFSRPPVSAAEATIVPSFITPGAGKKVKTPGEVAERLGYDLAAAKSPEQIATSIRQGTLRVPERIGERTGIAANVAVPGQLSPAAKGIYSVFRNKKSEENLLWEAAKQEGAKTPHTIASENIAPIQNKLSEVDKIADKSSLTEQQKVDNALLKQVLTILGKPFQARDKVRDIRKEVGPVTRYMRSERQLPYNIKKGYKTVGDTTATGEAALKEASRTQQELRQLQGGKRQLSYRGPYTETSKTTQFAPRVEQRTTLASDLVNARRFINENRNRFSKEAFDLLTNEKTGLITKELEAAGKNNKNFGRFYNQAYAATKKNASIYRDEAGIASKLGLTEDNLRALEKSGLQTPNQSATKLLNGISNKLSDNKTDLASELTLLSRATEGNPQAFSQIARGKIENIVQGMGMNLNKVEEGTPLLRQIFEYSNVPKKTYEPILADLQKQALTLKRHGISPQPTDMVSSPIIKALNGVLNVASLSMFGLAKSAAHAAFRGMKNVVSDTTPNDLLTRYRKSLYQGAGEKAIRTLSGPSVGAAVSQNVSEEDK